MQPPADQGNSGAGVVIKEGYVWKMKKRFFLKWKKRYLVLTPDCLKLFKRQQDFARSKKFSRIGLEGIIVRASPTRMRKENVFDLFTNKGQYVLAVENPILKTQWMAKIAETAEILVNGAGSASFSSSSTSSSGARKRPQAEVDQELLRLATILKGQQPPVRNYIPVGPKGEQPPVAPATNRAFVATPGMNQTTTADPAYLTSEERRTSLMRNSSCYPIGGAGGIREMLAEEAEAEHAHASSSPSPPSSHPQGGGGAGMRRPAGTVIGVAPYVQHQQSHQQPSPPQQQPPKRRPPPPIPTPSPGRLRAMGMNSTVGRSRGSVLVVQQTSYHHHHHNYNNNANNTTADQQDSSTSSSASSSSSSSSGFQVYNTGAPSPSAGAPPPRPPRRPTVFDALQITNPHHPAAAAGGGGVGVSASPSNLSVPSSSSTHSAASTCAPPIPVRVRNPSNSVPQHPHALSNKSLTHAGFDLKNKRPPPKPPLRRRSKTYDGTSFPQANVVPPIKCPSPAVAKDDNALHGRESATDDAPWYPHVSPRKRPDEPFHRKPPIAPDLVAPRPIDRSQIAPPPLPPKPKFGDKSHHVPEQNGDPNLQHNNNNNLIEDGGNPLGKPEGFPPTPGSPNSKKRADSVRRGPKHFLPAPLPPARQPATPRSPIKSSLVKPALNAVPHPIPLTVSDFTDNEPQQQQRQQHVEEEEDGQEGPAAKQMSFIDKLEAGLAQANASHNNHVTHH